MALGWDKETYGKAGNAMARGLYDQFILQSEVYSLRREGVPKVIKMFDFLGGLLAGARKLVKC
ncbi:hypothetical protein ABN235_18815, partial [Morganella morganii]|uniref:hypothetical protein n=1 Tax=Morganella morganii TaxID=582 RepID=UPI0032D9CD66